MPTQASNSRTPRSNVGDLMIGSSPLSLRGLHSRSNYFIRLCFPTIDHWLRWRCAKPIQASGMWLTRDIIYLPARCSGCSYKNMYKNVVWRVCSVDSKPKYHSTEPVHYGRPTYRPGGYRGDLPALLLWWRAVSKQSKIYNLIDNFRSFLFMVSFVFKYRASKFSKSVSSLGSIPKTMMFSGLKAFPYCMSLETKLSVIDSRLYLSIVQGPGRSLFAPPPPPFTLFSPIYSERVISEPSPKKS